MYVHVKDGAIDDILYVTQDFLSAYYGRAYSQSCVYVDYPVKVGWVWDAYQERFVPSEEVLQKTLPQLQEENKLLKAQLQAQTERSDFIEDCIAEMAMTVYGEV